MKDPRLALGILCRSSTPTEPSSTGAARELMQSGEPWVNYVNEVVFRELKHTAISIDSNYKISHGGMSALELLNLFKSSGWSWPLRWYRRNRNPAHSGGIHLENEVEKGRWLHLIIIPERNEPIIPSNGAGAPAIIYNWSVPPQRIDLHAENHWLQPSSAAHFRDFVKERYILPFLRWFI